LNKIPMTKKQDCRYSFLNSNNSIPSAPTPTGRIKPGQSFWFRPAAPQIELDWLMRMIPEAEAKLYRVLAELIPAPSMVLPNLARRQIKMAGARQARRHIAAVGDQGCCRAWNGGT